MKNSSAYFSLYSGIILLSTTGLFSNGLPLDALTLTNLRSIIAGVAILTALVVLRRAILIRNTKELIHIILISLVMGIHWVTYFHAMQVSSVAIGMLSLYTFPVMVVIIEAGIHRRLPHWIDVLSVILVMIGMVIMVDPFSHEISFDSSTLSGILWGTFSALLFAIRNVSMKYYFKELSSEQLMLFQLAVIALMTIPFIPVETFTAITGIDWLKLIILGVFTTAIGHTMVVFSYKSFPAKTVAMISCMQPVIGAWLAWLVLGETPTTMVFIGGMIILLVAAFESVSHNR